MKNNKSRNPLQQAGRGERARRAKQATFNRVGADSTIIRGNCLGSVVSTDINGQYTGGRLYSPGWTGGLAGTVPMQLAAFYSEGKFLPGTCAKWVPQIGYQTAGRVTVGFTTSPEVMSYFAGLGSFAARENFLRGLGNSVNFPLYEERTLEVPTTLRRRLFDSNANLIAGTDEYDRSVQVDMMFVVNGAPESTAVGSFEFHDHLHVSGLVNNTAT